MSSRPEPKSLNRIHNSVLASLDGRLKIACKSSILLGDYSRLVALTHLVMSVVEKFSALFLTVHDQVVVNALQASSERNATRVEIV